MITHQKFKTIKHHHLDWVYDKDGKLEYPDSALMLVQAGDGQWFLEQEFGDEFSQFPGVLKSSGDIYTVPTFFPDVESAARAAFALMKQVHPHAYDDRDLDEFLED